MAGIRPARLTGVRPFEPVDAGPLAGGVVFQSTDAPLDDVRITPAEARERLTTA